MDKRGRNKENKVCRSMTITDSFKVKKCLFDASKPEFISPKPEPSMLSCSPHLSQSPLLESPYALFQVCKRRYQKNSPETSDVTPHKRSNTADRVDIATLHQNNDICMASPASTTSVKLAVQKAMTETNLTGDFSKSCLLPVIEGKHPELNSVTPQTVADLLKERSSLTIRIIDCRYPYEFQGGHIKNAINMYFKGNTEKEFFSSDVTATKKEINDILIFYCEYSSERAPSMMRFLRKMDRGLNEDSYPFLFYPELYLIEGGYKAFYSSFKELCEPQEYRTMLDQDCTLALSFYRSECKRWSTKEKRSRRAKTLIF